MRVTEDEAMKMIDAFTDYIEGLVGEDIQYTRNPDVFSVELLRHAKRFPNNIPARIVNPLDRDIIIGGPGSRQGTYTLEVAPDWMKEERRQMGYSIPEQE